VRLNFKTHQQGGLLRIAIAVAASAVLASTVHPNGNVKTPPGQAQRPQLLMDRSVAAVFTRACVDCHSNNTVWPWYSYVPPASWLIERDVKEGRSHFNVSTWAAYSSEKKREILADIARVAANREMPVRQYLLIHKDARLSNEDVQTLISWASGERRGLRKKM
jgi:hypothetical protein